MMQSDPRTLAVFVLLARAARERELVTYTELAEEVECHHHVELTRILTCIANVCKDNGYPPLTALAVSKESLAPGEGFWSLHPEIQASERDGKWAGVMREVCLFDWRKVSKKLLI